MPLINKNILQLIITKDIAEWKVYKFEGNEAIFC